MNESSYKKIVIKVGSNVLTGADGLPDLQRIGNLTDQIATLKQQGKEVILVSSGAVAAGRSLAKLPEKYDQVSARQLLAAIGQVKLINIYSELFERYQLLCAQVLVSKEDFRDRAHYLNMKNCFSVLLQNNIVPIVNENDVISVTELMFTDNDELAGLIASMMNVDAVVILTNVDGIYNGNPTDPQSELIPIIDEHTNNFSSFVQTTKSNFGRGGMITKCNMANKLAQLGITVHIANGKRNNILLDLISGNQQLGTKFIPYKVSSNIKRWLAHAESYNKGTVIVNDGARNALLSNKASSLLTVGVTRIEGEFLKGDIIRIMDESGKYIGLGMAQYDSEKAEQRKGEKGHKPLVHYDYLFLNPAG